MNIAVPTSLVSSIPAPLRDDQTFLLDEASVVSELDLHSLIHDLVDWHQILGDRYMQDVPHDSSLADMA